jgi:hypothetical protein
LYNQFYVIALEALEKGGNAEQISIRLDDLSQSISTIRISGEIESEKIDDREALKSGQAKISISSSLSPSGEASIGKNLRHTTHDRVIRKGVETIYLSFGNINASIIGLSAVLGSPRIWLLIDEWSEVPIDLQPYLADLFRRTVLPVNNITIKIAAIEHRSWFSIQKDGGEYIGIELGADFSADLNLDDFLVFENDQTKATTFFKNLIYKHYKNSEYNDQKIDAPDSLIRIVFTQWPVFEEFVRAIEGVPRDALNLAAKIATKAFGQKIGMGHVRDAARDWYQQDKAAVIRSDPELSGLLERIIDDVIGNRKARAFLFSSSARDKKIDRLFDSRLLHILKKNISSHDEPGVRYDVYKIDYGCYVDLINTSKAPLGLFEADDNYVDVPKDDYRSIRRAILRMG